MPWTSSASDSWGHSALLRGMTDWMREVRPMFPRPVFFFRLKAEATRPRKSPARGWCGFRPFDELRAGPSLVEGRVQPEGCEGRSVLTALPELGRRLPHHSLERPAEGCLRFVADPGGNRCDLRGAACEEIGGELEAPLLQVLHRRDADDLRESLRANRAGRPAVVRQGGESPVVRRLIVHPRQRPPDDRIA